MSSSGKYCGAFLFLTFLGACVEPYLPALIEENPNYVVVNGILNVDGTAQIKLTTTTNINSVETAPAVSQAVVTIESSDNTSFQLHESLAGTYVITGLALGTDKKYRLRIKANGEEYLSEFVPIKNSPAIDSLTYSSSAEGVDINVHTHDPLGESKFYKWNFIETWEYSAHYYSSHRLVDNELVFRPAEDLRYICYDSEPGTTFALESTTRFSQDQVSNFKVHALLPRSVKMSRRYSILIKQQVLTEAGYQYWETLKKSTEQVGGLFDPLPATIQGNIHCISNPDRKAIGFFTASGVSEKRLFIGANDISQFYPRFQTGTGCQRDTLLFGEGVNYGDLETVVAPIDDRSVPIGFTYSTPHCIDCTQQGGVVVKPEFWN